MKIFIKHAENQTTNDPTESAVALNSMMEMTNATCMGVNLDNALDYVKFHERDEILVAAISKLRYGGVLKMTGVDIAAMSQHLANGTLNIQDINTACLNGRHSSNTTKNMMEKLIGFDMDVKVAKIDSVYYYIEATRPKPNAG